MNCWDYPKNLQACCLQLNHGGVTVRGAILGVLSRQCRAASVALPVAREETRHMPPRSKTPGVRLIARQRANGVTWYGRWRDPITGEWRDLNLTAQGLTTDELRARWRRRKTEELVDARRAAALGVTLTPIAQAVDDYLADCSGRSLRPSTLVSYRRALEGLRDWLVARGRASVQSITPADLWAYRSEVLRREAWDRSTLRTHVACVRAGLGWLRRAQLLPHVSQDVIEDLGRGVTAPRPVVLCLAQDELRALLRAAAAHDDWRCAAVVATAALTGMRWEEIAGLLWGEVALDAPPAGEIRLGATTPHDPRTKTRRARTLDLSVCPTLGELLRAIPRGGPWVFGGAAPLPRRRAGDPWCEQLQVLDRRWTWKALRQTCGTYLACAPSIWSAASAYMTARFLGHSVQVSERHYLGVLRGLSPEARTIEAVMGAKDEFDGVVTRVRAASGYRTVAEPDESVAYGLSVRFATREASRE